MTKDGKKVLMAIGGHIGDAELTSGGVLATASLRGDKIVTVALTGGERGNPPGMSVADYRKQKEEEARRFAEMLGGEAVVFPYTDGELPETDEVKLQLCDVIRKYKPDVLLTHWKNSMHKDHMATHRIVKDAQFFAGLPGVERELPAHYAAGPYYAENWEDSEGYVPYTYVEVTPEGFDLWYKAISTHWFTVHSPSFHYRDFYATLMKMRGYLCRKEYAETFTIEKIDQKTIITGF